VSLRIRNRWTPAVIGVLLLGAACSQAPRTVERVVTSPSPVPAPTMDPAETKACGEAFYGAIQSLALSGSHAQPWWPLDHWKPYADDLEYSASDLPDGKVRTAIRRAAKAIRRPWAYSAGGQHYGSTDKLDSAAAALVDACLGPPGPP
jgi:hypothetical protein